jgi:hypothetical protein
MRQNSPRQHIVPSENIACLDMGNVRVVCAAEVVCGSHAIQKNFRRAEVGTLSKISGVT